MIFLKIATIFFAVILFNSPCYAFLPYEDGKQAEWEASMRDKIRNLQQRPKGEAIEGLSGIVEKLNHRFKEPETDQIRQEASSALINIPEFSRYYSDKVRTYREAAERNEIPVERYLEVRREALPIWRLFPSHEAVETIAPLLADATGRDSPDRHGIYIWHGDSGVVIPCGGAANTLADLGIENPPKVGEGENSLEQVDAWKDWWDEVKAGKRTYRFIGSPIEYGPEGPVGAKEVSRREHDRQSVTGIGKAASPNSNSGEETPLSPNKPWLKWITILASLLALAGGWMAFKKRNVPV